MDTETPWRDQRWQAHTQYLLNSFRRLLGRDLIDRSGDVESQAQRLFDASFVVVSHDMQQDPVLNYGNAAALALWDMQLPQLLQTPSRQTAEPVHRDERAVLLARVTQHGYIDDYAGVRISSSGRRFRIENAIVFNLQDDFGQAIGQAATFEKWDFLEPD